jgi:hypothetical protein
VIILPLEIGPDPAPYQERGRSGRRCKRLLGMPCIVQGISSEPAMGKESLGTSLRTRRAIPKAFKMVLWTASDREVLPSKIGEKMFFLY